jgi:SAM-dependent methyltransferase
MNPAEFANIAQSEQRFWWYRGMNRILFRLLDPIASERQFTRVLEAGCGTGYLAKLLAQRYEWPVHAVDLGWEGLAFARSMNVPRLAQADIASLPFRDGAFDAVLSMDVVVHFPLGEEGRAIKELVRVLRSRHSEFAHERQRFTKRRLLQLATSNGIDVERCTYANSLLVPVALAKFRVWEPLTKAVPASGVTPVNPMLDRVLYGALEAESKWIAKGRNFAFGQSLILIGWKRS